MNTEQSTPPGPSSQKHAVGSSYPLAGRALALFRRVDP
jgi:hypothetical protein